MTLNELIENVILATTNEYGFTDDWIENAVVILKQQEQKITKLEKDLFMLQKHYDQLCEDCTCQGGHSEAYLKAKGKL
jgi:hypothetical protein